MSRKSTPMLLAGMVLMMTSSTFAFEKAKMHKLPAACAEKGSEYFSLPNDHGHILINYVFSKYAGLSRDMYECQQCGRLHI